MRQTIIAEDKPSAMAKELGLNWHVQRVQEQNLLTGEPIGNRFHLYNSETKTFLGAVGGRYEIFDNDQLLAAADRLYDALSDMGRKPDEYSVFQIDNGRLIALQMRVGQFETVGHDPHLSMLTILHSNDAKMPLGLGYTAFRIICTNTYRRALESLKGNTARHTPMLSARVSELSDLVLESAQAEEQYKALANEAAKRQVKAAEADKLLDAVLQITAERQKDKAANAGKERLKAKERILQLFEDNDGGAIKQIAGSRYALFNAVTRYVDHEPHLRQTARQQNGDAVLEYSLVGAGVKLKERAFEQILLNGSRRNAAVLDSILDNVSNN
jgi:hypothetical protein